MYLKGFEITYEKEKLLMLPKWDFGGDKPYTNRMWNKILSDIRALTENSYPLSVSDLDKADGNKIILKSREEFENWFENDFSK